MVIRLVVLAMVAGCGAHRGASLTSAAPIRGDDVVMYRDWALVRQRVELDLPATPATAKVAIAAGVTADAVVVVDRGRLTVRAIHAGEPCSAPCDPWPTELSLDVTAPRAGHYAIVVAYLTDRLRWDAAYTMTTTAVRDHAILSGAIAIRNTTGLRLRAAVHVIDAELGASGGRTAERLATTLVGGAPSSTPAAMPRDLGRVELADGETRVAMLGTDAPRRMRSVLVYDPIGTKLDNPGAAPVRDPLLGVRPPAPPTVTESFEVERDERASAGLPAGPVRLLERRGDGSLAVLGESRLFDAATRVAELDTIAVGTADGVTGHRERRELSVDDENRRLVEEFVITIENTRAHAVDVLLREHLYRGQNWTLAYHSAPSAAKEGPQQIALRTGVPAKAQHKIRYVVVYTWNP